MGSFAASRTSVTAFTISTGSNLVQVDTDGFQRASNVPSTARMRHYGLWIVSDNHFEDLNRRTLLLECLDDVFQFLSRDECVFTCFAIKSHHSHHGPRCPRRHALAGPGRWLGLRRSFSVILRVAGEVAVVMQGHRGEGSVCWCAANNGENSSLSTTT
jgi:hypothetical protein